MRYDVPPINLYNANLFLSYATMFYLYRRDSAMRPFLSNDIPRCGGVSGSPKCSGCLRKLQLDQDKAHEQETGNARRFRHMPAPISDSRCEYYLK
jgi:protein-disulfide isomerase